MIEDLKKWAAFSKIKESKHPEDKDFVEDVEILLKRLETVDGLIKRLKSGDNPENLLTEVHEYLDKYNDIM